MYLSLLVLSLRVSEIQMQHVRLWDPRLLV